MMDYGRRRAVLLRTKEPTLGHIQLGKICRMMGGARFWVYANNISASYRQGAEFGIAPCVIRLMRVWRIPWINYYDGDDGVTYGASLRAVLELATPKSYSYRPAYYYLPISEWGKSKGRRRYSWVAQGNELRLAWGEPLVKQVVAEQPALL